MGAEKSKNVAGDAYELSEDDAGRLRRRFAKQRDVVDAARLEELFDEAMPHCMSRRLRRLVTSWDGLVQVAARFVKGTCHDHCVLLMHLAVDPEPNQREPSLSVHHLKQLVSGLVDSFVALTSTSRQCLSWRGGIQGTGSEELTTFLLSSLLAQGEGRPATYDLERIEAWFSQSPLVAPVFRHVLGAALGFDSDGAALFPACCGVDWSKAQSVLGAPDILLLNQHLPAPARRQWRFLFGSRQYGESFAQLVGRLVNRGPSLIVVRDKGGHVFGGFASCSWQVQSRFSGTDDCFLFRLRPDVAVHHASGYNDHFMYLNVNQHTMPNGLGMGGQLEYFGFYLSSEYGTGSCAKSCTTFVGPGPLHSCPGTDFDVDAVEVWGVGPEPEPEEGVRHSALDAIDPEVKAILELAGRKLVSEPIRKRDEQIDRQGAFEDS